MRVDVTPLEGASLGARDGRRRTTLVVLGFAVAVLAVAAGPRPAGAALAVQRLVVYSVAEQEQYVNNAGRATGPADGNNPFGNYKD